MRRLPLVLVTFGLLAAGAPAAEAATKARIFWVTGTSGSVTASEVAETRRTRPAARTTATASRPR